MGGPHEMKPRHFERVYPYLFAAIFAAAYWRFHVQFPTGADILNASITVGAILIGFLATAKSIIATLTSEKWQRFKTSLFFGLLTSYLEEAIYSALLHLLHGRLLRSPSRIRRNLVPAFHGDPPDLHPHFAPPDWDYQQRLIRPARSRSSFEPLRGARVPVHPCAACNSQGRRRADGQADRDRTGPTI